MIGNPGSNMSQLIAKYYNNEMYLIDEKKMFSVIFFFVKMISKIKNNYFDQ